MTTPGSPTPAPAPARRGTPLRMALAGLVVLAAAALVVVVAARPGPTVFPGPTSLPSRPSQPAGATLDPSGGPFDAARIAVTLEPFVDGLDSPLGILNAADGSGRLFVVEQGGTVRIVRDGAVVGQPFLDVSDRITSGGERGLLGMAFAPGFPDDPRVFIDYTDDNGDTQVSSMTVASATADQVEPGSETKILSVKQPFANHNGGALAFDPTGMLLIALGDGGSGGDPQGNGQSLKTMLGKILRIDVANPTADRPYAIPSDNPYADGADGRRPEIWLTGLRNPWRMSVDRVTGDLWIGDVGQGAWEEIDVQRAGTPGGTNFGWNKLEGTHCFEPRTGCEDPALTAPATDYGHDLGCTVIGGNVYRGTEQAALVGGYLFGDYCSGLIWAIDPAADGYQSPVQVAESGVSLSAFGEDDAGELYVADISGDAILRVVAGRR